MRAHTIFNWALALLIIAIYTAMAQLNGPSDHQAQADLLGNLQVAIKNEAAQARFAKAASTICGDNAGWYLVDDAKTIQCTTKRGFKTQKVAL